MTPRATLIARLVAGSAALTAIASAALAGCEARVADAPADGGALEDAGDAAPADAAHPILPYPPGPYGGGVGDVIPNLRLAGYPLSREQRDSTKVPFRAVTLAEVRSDPDCRCLVVLVNAAGQRCGPCVTASRALATLVASDRSICAMEGVRFTYDTHITGEEDQPPTRADLELMTQAIKQPYPVGLMSRTEATSIGATAYPGIPDHLIVRPSDMRIVAFMPGSSGSLGVDVRTACATPQETPATLAKLSTPRRIEVDATHVFVTDADLGVVRVPRDGGEVDVLARPSGAAEALAVDATYVAWGTTEPGAAFELGRARKDGGAKLVLATSPAPFRSVALDGENVYFARKDGVVGVVPVGGGAVQELVVGEASPTSVQVDGANVYWVEEVSGDVVFVPKSGGPRRVVLSASSLELDLRAKEILRLGPSLLVRVRSAVAGGIRIVPAAGGTVGEVTGPAVAATSFTYDAVRGEVVIGTADPQTGAGSVGTAPGRARTNDLEPFALRVPGLTDVVAVGSDGRSFYWASDPRSSPRSGELRKVGR